MATITDDGIEWKAKREAGVDSVGPANILVLEGTYKAEAAGDTAPSGEITTGGLARATATAAVVDGTTSQLSNTFTCMVSDTVYGVAIQTTEDLCYVRHAIAAGRDIEAGDSLSVVAQGVQSQVTA